MRTNNPVLPISNEIHILGSGLSGLSAALLLSKEGYTVTVHEKRGSIGSNFSETIHSIKNYDNPFSRDVIKYIQEDLGIKIKECFSPVKDFIRISPNGRQYITRRRDGEPVLYNIIRGSSPQSLDSELYRLCLESGVVFDFNTKYPPESCNIIATGAKYLDFMGFGYSYREENPNYDSVLVFFNNEFAPAGYGYILKTKDVSTFSIFYKKSKATLSSIQYFDKFKKYLAESSHIKIPVTIPISVDSGGGFTALNKSLYTQNQFHIGANAGIMTADYGFALLLALKTSKILSLNIKNPHEFDRIMSVEIYPEIIISNIKRLQIDRYSNRDYDRIIKHKSGIKLVDPLEIDRSNKILYTFSSILLRKKGHSLPH